MIEIGRHLIVAEGAYMPRFSEEETNGVMAWFVLLRLS